METPSSLKEEEEANTTSPKVEESALAPKKKPVEPVHDPAVEEKELTKPAKKKKSKSGTGRDLSRLPRNQRQQNKRNKHPGKLRL